jgi:hypothetical protein
MPEENEQATKDQHYVPQFYLKKFVNADNKLEILDCDRRKLVIARTPKSVCNEEYFYSVNNTLDEASQVLEKEFQRIEDHISKYYDGIALKFVEFQEITEEDKMQIATFMSMQYLRGPYMRKRIKKMDENVIKEITKMRFGSESIHDSFDRLEEKTGEKTSEKQRKEVIEFAKKGDYTVETSNASHLRMLGEMEGFRNLLFGKEWTVYISKSSKKFITSDNPVIEIFPKWAGKTFWGPDFMQRTHQFALTPEVLIIADEPRNLPKEPTMGKIKRKTFFDNRVHNDKILELNFPSARFAMAYAYANNKDLLQAIIDSDDLYKKQLAQKIIRQAKV